MLPSTHRALTGHRRIVLVPVVPPRAPDLSRPTPDRPWVCGECGRILGYADDDLTDAEGRALVARRRAERFFAP